MALLESGPFLAGIADIPKLLAALRVPVKISFSGRLNLTLILFGFYQTITRYFNAHPHQVAEAFYCPETLPKTIFRSGYYRIR
jgi:hypothetical protein